VNRLLSSEKPDDADISTVRSRYSNIFNLKHFFSRWNIRKPLEESKSKIGEKVENNNFPSLKVPNQQAIKRNQLSRLCSISSS